MKHASMSTWLQIMVEHVRLNPAVCLNEFKAENTVDFSFSVVSWWRGRTCQQVCGDFLSRMYCVRGEGSSSYLSKGTLSITMGSASRQEKRTWGWAERGGCMGNTGRMLQHNNFLHHKQI